MIIIIELYSNIYIIIILQVAIVALHLRIFCTTSTTIYTMYYYYSYCYYDLRPTTTPTP
jgi:hypothetical protein